MGGETLTVGAGRGAAVGVVAKGVDVEATLSVGVVAGDVVGYCRGSRLGLLLEDDCATDLFVTAENADCRAACIVSQSILLPSGRVGAAKILVMSKKKRTCGEK